MSDTTVKEEGRGAGWNILLRILVIVVLATAIGRSLNLIAKTMDRAAHPAGFARGMLQGALMPMAMPNLLFGNDVIIYTQNNTGVGYKLGYTAGVNACGAIFFGVFFWRVNRWRRREKARISQAGPNLSSSA
jgi:hypothetical protein